MSAKKKATTKAAKPKKSQELDIGKVQLHAVNVEHMRLYLAQALSAEGDGSPLPTTTEGLVALVHAHQRKLAAADPAHDTECSVCGGESDSRLPSCPFCNDGEAYPETGIVPARDFVEPGSLDAAIERVNAAKRRGALAYWELGHELYNIFENRLYTQRLNDKGKPKYANWTAFVVAEIGMGSSQSYKVMDCAVTFDRDTFNAIGVTKLGLLLRVPEEDRAEALKKAASSTVSEIEQEVRRLAGNAPPRDTGRTGFKGGAAASAKGAAALRGKKKVPQVAARDGSVTAVAAKPRLKIPLYQRGKPDKRALRLAQDPHGSMQLENDVELLVSIVQTAEGLSAVVEFRRATEGGTKSA